MSDSHDAGHELRLTAGPTTRHMIVTFITGVLTILLTLLGTFFGVFIAYNDAPVGGILICLMSFGVAYVTVQTLRHLRHSVFWLEDTTLVQRRFRRNLRRDLMRALIIVDSVPGSWWSGHQVPRLIATEQGFRPLILPLRDPYRGDALLTPIHLRRLADIIESRSDVEEAANIARSLREMASDPFGLHH